MAVNKQPYLKNSITGEVRPYIGYGKVQAGSTQAIKRGEICAFNETSGYFVPVDAVADCRYSLAIANEEQKSDSLERYMEFIFPREGDIFEFALNASRQIAYGDALTLTASDSQTLTYDADGFVVAHSVGSDNYPEIGTTIAYRSYAQVEFRKEVSYYYKNIVPMDLKKVINLTGDYTLKVEDNGCVITNTGASGGVTLTAPSGTVPVGWHFKMVCTAADAMAFDPKPDTTQLVVQGAVQTAGYYASITDEADFIEWMWDGTYWVAISSISGADTDITIQSE